MKNSNQVTVTVDNNLSKSERKILSMNESVTQMTKELEQGKAFLKHMQKLSINDDLGDMFPQFKNTQQNNKSKSPPRRATQKFSKSPVILNNTNSSMRMDDMPKTAFAQPSAKIQGKRSPKIKNKSRQKRMNLTKMSVPNATSRN